MDDTKWKEDLLGTVGKIKIDKDAKINYSRLLEPLEWEKAVCRVVCNQCKVIQEIDLVYATDLIKFMQDLEIPVPKEFKTKGDFKGWYITFPYCIYCHQNDKIEDFQIKRVPDLC